MPKSNAQVESEMLSQVNSELEYKTEGVCINNRNIENVHPHDCQCSVHAPSYPEGNSVQEENKRREELDYGKA